MTRSDDALAGLRESQAAPVLLAGHMFFGRSAPLDGPREVRRCAPAWLITSLVVLALLLTLGLAP